MSFLEKVSLQKRIIAICVALPAVVTGSLLCLYWLDSRNRAVDATVEKARAICLATESAREQKQSEWEKGIISHKEVADLFHGGRSDEALVQIPIVAAWETAMKKAKQGGYQFRVPAMEPRNPDNAPSPLEREALTKIQAGDLEELHVVDKVNNNVHYFRPVKISSTCMACHGDPNTSKEIWGTADGIDITGYAMENWSVGDMHGAFEVIQSLDSADAVAAAGVKKASVIAGFGILAMVSITWLILTRTVTLPLLNSATAIDQATSSLRRNSEELDHSAHSTSEETTSMASAVNEINSGVSSLAFAVKEMGTSIDEISGNAQKAAEIASTAVAESDATSDAIDRLLEKSDRIGNVISVINGLAEQTNLLALNATIEAARAGDAGKGFAVVASEVKELANETSKATEDISNAIGDIQSNSRTVTESASRIGEIIASVSDAQQSIAAAVEEQSATTAGIGQSVTEVENASEGLNNQVTSVAKNSQLNASQIEESRDSVVEIEKMVSALRDFI